MSVETIITAIADDNPKKYVDQYELDPDATVDPLALVVPTTEDLFFGTYACNVIIYTNLYLTDDLDWDIQVEDSKARLIATYALFAKYELHIFIDSDADGIIDADSGTLTDFDTMLTDLADELADYGVVYYGQMTEDDIEAELNDVIIPAFVNGT